MKTASNFAVALVTAPNLPAARRLAKAILHQHLAACVSLIPGLESHYWWQDRLERAREVLLIVKTTRKQLRALEHCVLSNHPYDTPEFVVLPLTAGADRYLQWITRNVSPPPPSSR